MKRRDAREAAFLLIFEFEFRDEPVGELIEAALESGDVELDGYADRMVRLVWERREELDGKITRHLNKWKLERLPKATLALLRLAVCELDCFADIPVGVSINEAVELAKKYATEEDAAYLNGVLGSYVRANPPVKDEESRDKEAGETP